MTWTELDYRWAVVLWKGREIILDDPSQNYCSTHKNGLSSLTGCITWTCGESERTRAVTVIRSSYRGDPHDDQVDLQFIKILSKSYVRWCCNIKHATDDCKIWKARSPKSEKYAYLSYSVTMTHYLEPQTCFEGRISVFCFFGTVCQKIFEIFVLGSSKKVVRWKISLQTSDLQNRQCKVKKWFVIYKSWAKIF